MQRQCGRGGIERAWCAVVFTTVLLQPVRLVAEQPATPSPVALKRLSLEQLTSLEITSVSRSREPLGEAAAAVAIVTSEDIRRGGAMNVPEALRSVPGIHVGQRNANSWAVSSRGFSSITSEKLLVLSDTRSIYTPLFSGVFWDAQDYIMEDIDRIEVIRGPGGALWGSNAVNGVVNITTKSAHDTQGTHLEAGAGSAERARIAVRHGAALNEDVGFRVFGQFTEYDSSQQPDPVRSDDWRIGHVGFRTDWLAGARDVVTVHGKAYRGSIGQLQPAVNIIGRPGPGGDLEVAVSGEYLQGRWVRTLAEGSEFDLRAYYDHTRRDDPSFDDELHTVDVDLQHSFDLAGSQQVSWGLNYRFMSNRNEGKGIFAVAPPDSDDQLLSAFVQDQVSLGDAVRLTLGTKLEENDFSGFEVQPSLRAVWDVAPGIALWSAVSRAVRVPTRLERDVAIDVTDPAVNPGARLLGSGDFESEELIAYELGLRWQARASLFFDLATYYNDYDGLSSLEFGEPFLDPSDGRTILPVLNRNLTDGRAVGAELLVSYRPHASWRLDGSYSYVDVQLESRGQDLNRSEFIAGATPRHQFALQSFLDLPGGWQFDARFRSLSRIERLPDVVSGEGVPGYSELDARLGYTVSETIDLAVAGRNLLHAEHAEFGPPATRGEISRSVYARIDYRF